MGDKKFKLNLNFFNIVFLYNSQVMIK